MTCTHDHAQSLPTHGDPSLYWCPVCGAYGEELESVPGADDEVSWDLPKSTQLVPGSRDAIEEALRLLGEPRPPTGDDGPADPRFRDAANDAVLDAARIRIRNWLGMTTRKA